MSDDLWRWSAAKLANALREKSVSSREIVQAHLERIDAVNGAVNALTVVFTDDALAAADAADASIASRDAVGPLHGVPITVKENIDVSGSATTHGVLSLKNSIPEQDAPIVRHLKNAGAIVIGRTNMPDFGMRWHTDNDLHGATLNPWDSSRTPGGSSGGEAVAIATGMSPLGIGNDMGGSTRQPAVNCGIVGLRPSTGRVSRVMSAIFDDPPMFYDQIACVNGPMARQVGDLRLALEVMGQSDPTDPSWIPGIAPPVSTASESRVGLVKDPSGEGVAPAVARALEAAVRFLEQAGYAVDEIEPPLIEEADDTIRRLYETEIGKYFDDILPIISDDAGKILKAVIGDGKPDVTRYRDAIAERHRIAAIWSRLMERFPLILGPVSTMEAFCVGYDTGGFEAMQRLIRSFRLTELCNLLGLPSIALPVSVEGGLPQGVQIIGRRFDEDRCFAAAEAIERAVQLPTPIDPVNAG
ncbi:MAG: amidase [Planctomycetota bacterium]|nr:amidase [Planctomycetota bacterium]